MIHWAWLIPAGTVGVWFGYFLCALMVAASRGSDEIHE